MVDDNFWHWLLSSRTVTIRQISWLFICVGSKQGLCGKLTRSLSDVVQSTNCPANGGMFSLACLLLVFTCATARAVIHDDREDHSHGHLRCHHCWHRVSSCTVRPRLHGHYTGGAEGAFNEFETPSFNHWSSCYALCFPTWPLSPRVNLKVSFWPVFCAVLHTQYFVTVTSTSRCRGSQMGRALGAYYSWVSHQMDIGTPLERRHN